MERVYVVRLNQWKEFKIYAIQCTEEEYYSGFFWDGIFYPRHTLSDTIEQARRMISTIKHEVGYIDAA